MRCLRCGGTGAYHYVDRTDRDGKVMLEIRRTVCDACKGSGREPLTNADRIRSMSDEALAEVIYNGISSDACDYCKHNNLHCDGSPCRGKAHTEIIVEWLQQPAEEGKQWLKHMFVMHAELR